MPNWKKLIVSGSDANLSSLNIDGSLTASSAYLESASIGHLQTIYETASVIYSSGSTKFGDTSDDTHEITGSLLVSGSSYSTNWSGTFSGSFQGNGSNLTGVIVNPFPYTGSGEMQGQLVIESFNDYIDDYVESYFAGTAISSNGDFALTGSIFSPYINANTFTGSFLNNTGYVVLTQVSESLNFADDTAAQAGGVPLGGLYRNGNAIQIRIT